LKTPRLAVIGAGSWGTALAVLAAKNAHPVYLWGRESAQVNQMILLHENTRYLPGVVLSSKIKPTVNLASAVTNVKDIILAAPSQGFREVLAQMKPYLNAEHRLIIATKGLDPILGCFLTESTESILDHTPQLAVLSGPGFAAEVAASQPSAITLACLSDDFAQDVITLLHNSFFRVYRTTDIKGVQVGGAVKNVLAIAAGIADGLGFGANTQSALITRGLAEMVRLGTALGGCLETFLGLAGAGDLILTATNNQSRNRRFGVLVGQGMPLKEAEASIQQVVEGAHNARQVCELAAKHGVEMPIVAAVDSVLQGGISPQVAVNRLLMRAPKMEGL
jgi:glycerol-3-phosphate dehydrogenase (NAD(P)+)